MRDLDQAIDHVAKRLTRVDDDAQFNARIVAALPERTTWFGWLTHAWAPRLAMIAIVATAAVLWNSRRTTELPPASRSIAGVQQIHPQQFAATSEPAPRTVEPIGTKPLEPKEPVEPLEPFIGLPSLVAPGVLAVSDLTPAEVSTGEALSVKPLEIESLALTAESFPERE